MRDFRKYFSFEHFGVGPAGKTLAFCAAAALLIGAPGAETAFGQNRGGATIKICPNVKGATCIDEPGANTSVAPQFKASYDAYLKMKAAAHGGTQYTRGDYAKMPDWSGLWTRDPGAGIKFDPAQQFDPFEPDKPVKEHTSAKLTPKYKAALEEKIRQVKMGNEWDQLSDCLPAGFPRWLTEPFLREFVVTPGQTWWTNEQQSEARRIYTDGRGHIPQDQSKPLWDGDSIGFWDGDTLVVHTISVTHGQYNRQNPDYSEQTSVLERIRMINPNTIQDDITVYDPKSLEKPWHVVSNYVRVTNAGSRIDMWSCEQNNNVVRTAIGASQFILPGETVTVKRGYREPDTFYLTDAQKKLFSKDP